MGVLGEQKMEENIEKAENSLKENRERVGLVLEGGGMRGMYTAGVLDTFLIEGIMPDGIIGVSAGAIHGCSFLAGQLGRSVRYNLKYIKDKRYVSIRNLIRTGDIFDAEFCYDILPNELSLFDYDTFEKNAKKIAFYTVASDLETGKADYHRCYDFREEMDYMRASASLPLVSNIVELDGKKLLDGGTTDSIPLAFFRSIGFKKNIVVLTRPEGYVKKPESALSLLGMKYKAYPNYIEACRNRHKQYNQAVQYAEYFEREGSAIIIRPSKDLNIGRLEKDINKLKYVYKLGRRDARAKLLEIKEMMGL